MTRRDQIRAFSMRCCGATWEQIGKALYCDERSVARELRRTLENGERRPKICYGALERILREQYRGSINAFARRARVSPHRLRRVLAGVDLPPESMVRKLTKATGLSREEVFAP